MMVVVKKSKKVEIICVFLKVDFYLLLSVSEFLNEECFTQIIRLENDCLLACMQVRSFKLLEYEIE